jgi:hypothetical protein
VSARGLGAQPITHGNYPTPPSLVRRLAEVCPTLLTLPVSAIIEEPMAGEGALVRELRRMYPWARIIAKDVRPHLHPAQQAAGADMAMQEDATAPRVASLLAACDLVITNPDFAVFDALLSKHRTCRANIPLALLCRAGVFSGAQERAAMLDRVGAPDVYDLPGRVRFVEVVYQDEDGKRLARGAQDSVGHAWFVWPAGPPRVSGTWRMLRPETAEERAYVPPLRVITVNAAEWEKRGKKAAVVREEMVWR